MLWTTSFILTQFCQGGARANRSMFSLCFSPTLSIRLVMLYRILETLLIILVPFVFGIVADWVFEKWCGPRGKSDQSFSEDKALAPDDWVI